MGRILMVYRGQQLDGLRIYHPGIAARFHLLCQGASVARSILRELETSQSVPDRKERLVAPPRRDPPLAAGSPVLKQEKTHIDTSSAASVVVPWDSASFGNTLIGFRAFQDRPAGKLAHKCALYLLPRSLRLGDRIPFPFERAAAGGQLRLLDEHVDPTPPEVDSDSVAGPDQGQAAAHGSFRRSVEDGG
jgi:hypothetical protein